MIKTDVLILGGGLAGLSTAYHLNKFSRLSSLIVEKEPVVGGTAGSVEKNGFIFDYTGHLLHLHDPYAKKLILNLLKGNCAVHERKAWVYSNKTYTPYPFQAHTFGLPENVIKECVLGFLKTIHKPQKAGNNLEASFRDFALRQFGEGICKHFLFPYNEKMWRRPLSRLTCEWQGRFVPKPSASEVVFGALAGAQGKEFGYNAVFRYPIRGGVRSLAQAFEKRLRKDQVRTFCPVTAIDLEKKEAEILGIGLVAFSHLVNTLPLPDFLKMTMPLPEPVRAATKKLRYNNVYCLNIGVDRPHVSDKHWIYFPESIFPFYRVGFMSNFSFAMAPKKTSSLYVEISRRSDEKVNLKILEKQVFEGLLRCGIFKRADRFPVKFWMPIHCAYVIYDFDRPQALKPIFSYFAKKNIESIGRYGAWKYSFMEEAIMDGKKCAERLKTGQLPAAPVDIQGELKALR